MEYSFFEKLWLTKIQAEIYTDLYRLGSQPASVIARQLWLERTKVYRNLISMTKLGLVKKATKNWIQVFFVKDISDFSRFVDKRIENLEYIENNKMRIMDEIQKTKLETANLPKISIYDSSEWVWSIFDDILNNIRTQKLLTIRMFASNTYLEQNENIKAEEFAKKFFDTLAKDKIHTDTFIWSGNLIMERIDTYFDTQNIWELPATQSSINIILVGKTTYIIIYNKTPQWIKIENENLADAMHILFDVAKKYNELMDKKS
ncbi:MAG: hypothetical protein ACD_3C00062G0002 [uncultured bacterium (gcode 4)]|uniref:Transcription regulator TrmB N-terminal domain-containing protein n=1 Tax=uncultured bacterium (gcode 4) TaxID=1234023 RepID=K2G2C5_9BACT|nr:MAG: hypothetical protein ACD_3C00062G0002 [uncultured bacterium (gcode 4)]